MRRPHSMRRPYKMTIHPHDRADHNVNPLDLSSDRSNPPPTKRINEQRGTPGAPVWQRDYFEHIIRNDESLNRIREYILNNPLQWALDRENPLAQGAKPEDAWAS